VVCPPRLPDGFADVWRLARCCLFCVFVAAGLPVNPMAEATEASPDGAARQAAEILRGFRAGIRDVPRTEQEFAARQKNIRKLAARGEKIFPGLVFILKDPEAGSPKGTIKADPQAVVNRVEAAVSIIMEMDSNLDFQPLRAAVRGLLERPDPVFPYSGKPVPGMRVAALTMLGKIGTHDDIPRLVQLLNDEQAIIRHNAATALAKLGDRAAAEKLDEAARERRAALKEGQDERWDTSILKMEEAAKTIRARLATATTRESVRSSSWLTPGLAAGLGLLAVVLVVVLFRRRRA